MTYQRWHAYLVYSHTDGIARLHELGLIEPSPPRWDERTMIRDGFEVIYSRLVKKKGDRLEPPTFDSVDDLVSFPIELLPCDDLSARAKLERYERFDIFIPVGDKGEVVGYLLRKRREWA